MKTKLCSIKDDKESNFLNVSKPNIQSEIKLEFSSQIQLIHNLAHSFSKSIEIFQFKGFAHSVYLCLGHSLPHPNPSGPSLDSISLETAYLATFSKASLSHTACNFLCSFFFPLCIAVMALIPIYKYFISVLFRLNLFISCSML